MEMLLYFCLIELVPFASCFPLFVSFSLSPSTLPLIHAKWTISTDSRSRCDDPYLTFCLFFSPSSIAHLFLFCLGFFFLFLSFNSPLPSICAAVCSTFICLPHMSLYHFSPSPPLDPHSPVLDIPIYCVCLPFVYQRLCIQGYMHICGCAYLMLYMSVFMLVCTFCTLYFWLWVCSSLSGLEVWRW